MNTRRSRPRKGWSALTIGLIVLISCGCSDGRSDKRSDAGGSKGSVKATTTSALAAETTTSSGPSTTSAATTSADPTNETVLTAYLGFWDLYIELGGTPPPFDPARVTARLDELTTGAERTQLFDFLQKNAATGLVLRGDIAHSPDVVSNDGTVAVVEDCMDDRIGVYRVADSSRTDTDDPARRLYTVALRQSDGGWKVETVTTGPEPCTV